MNYLFILIGGLALFFVLVVVYSMGMQAGKALGAEETLKELRDWQLKMTEKKEASRNDG